MNEPTIAHIQAEACRVFSVTRAELLSDRRTARLARVRQIAMWAAHMMTTKTNGQIAAAFNRDSSMTGHSRRCIEADILYGREAGAMAEDFRLQLAEHHPEPLQTDERADEILCANADKYIALVPSLSV